MKFFRHARRLFSLDHVSDRGIHSHPSRRACLCVFGWLHLGHDEQSRPVLRDDPIDEHVIGEDGLFKICQRIGCVGNGFHKRINVYTVDGASDIIHRGDTGHIFVPDGFDSGLQSKAFRELFDNA